RRTRRADRTRARRAACERRRSTALSSGVEDDLVRAQSRDAARARWLRAGATAAPAPAAAPVGAARSATGAVFGVREYRPAAAHGCGAGAGGVMSLFTIRMW